MWMRLSSANCSRAFRSRLKICTTLMPLMCSCRNALMRAMAVRMRRLASRTLSRKTQVRHEDQRQHGKSGQRQLPVHVHHDRAEEDQQEGVVGHGRDAGGKQVVQRVHIRGHARDQAAHGAAVVEAHRQALQVLKDFLAQVVHGVLADVLHDADLEVHERRSSGASVARNAREIQPSPRTASACGS